MQSVCRKVLIACLHFGRVAATVGVGIDNFTDKTMCGREPVGAYLMTPFSPLLN